MKHATAAGSPYKLSAIVAEAGAVPERGPETIAAIHKERGLVFSEDEDAETRSCELRDGDMVAGPSTKHPSPW